MSKEIICPLLSINSVLIDKRNNIKINTQPTYCITEQCAWWFESKEKCAILMMKGK